LNSYLNRTSIKAIDNPLPSAEIVLIIISQWFEDYNENYAHSGLKMLLLHEFRSAQTAAA
jgi:hypothetical protein